MGLANVYSFARISNWHLPFRFKATFQATENAITTDNKSVISFAVKSITKPHFPLGTNSINQYYGTTRFVMPTLDFDKATLDITFVEEDSGRLQNFLMSLLGNATGGPTAVENIRIDEYDMGMTMLLSSRVYTCQLKSIDLPDYSRSGSASIVTVTGHFVVHSIKNVSLALSDMQNPVDIDKTAEKDMNDTAKPPKDDTSPINDVTPPVPPEPPKPPPKRIAGDDPAMQAANKRQDQAIKDTDEVLSKLMDNMYANASQENQEELVNAGYEAYKKDHSKNAMLGDAIDDAGMQKEWSNMSDADKMRYMLLAQGIDVTDGISDDESSRDENGKTELQRLTETLDMMSDAKQEELEDDEKYKEFLATDVAIIAKVSENENAARENTKKVNDEVNEQINKEEEEKARAALEARQQQDGGTPSDPENADDTGCIDPANPAKGKKADALAKARLAQQEESSKNIKAAAEKRRKDFEAMAGKGVQTVGSGNKAITFTVEKANVNGVDVFVVDIISGGNKSVNGEGVNLSSSDEKTQVDNVTLHRTAGEDLDMYTLVNNYATQGVSAHVFGNMAVVSKEALLGKGGTGTSVSDAANGVQGLNARSIGIEFVGGTRFVDYDNDGNVQDYTGSLEKAVKKQSKSTIDEKPISGSGGGTLSSGAYSEYKESDSNAYTRDKRGRGGNADGIAQLEKENAYAIYYNEDELKAAGAIMSLLNATGAAKFEEDGGQALGGNDFVVDPLSIVMQTDKTTGKEYSVPTKTSDGVSAAINSGAKWTAESHGAVGRNVKATEGTVETSQQFVDGVSIIPVDESVLRKLNIKSKSKR